MPEELSLPAAFVVGLLGSLHCIGMCGGIVGALTMGLPDSIRNSPARMLPFLLAYNAGRLASYALAGALVGGLVTGGSALFGNPGFPLGGVIGALFMIGLGLYVSGWWQALRVFEQAGSHLWRRLEPLGRRFMPVDSAGKALGLGLIWGWLPCGMVYAVLAWSATAGGMVDSALLMLAFGLGTLPMLLAMGGAANLLQRLARNRWIRQVAGLVLIGFGILILNNALTRGAHQHHHTAAAQML